MNKIKVLPICPKCGDEMNICENCEKVGCKTCDNWICTPDDVDLCSECASAIQEDWNRMTENGTKICEKCAYFLSDDDDDGFGACRQEKHNRMATHVQAFCKEFAPKSCCLCLYYQGTYELGIIGKCPYRLVTEMFSLCNNYKIRE